MHIDKILTTINVDLNYVRRSYASWFHESNELLRYRPTDNGWSCLQILEHVTLTSHFLLLIIERASVKAKRRSGSTPVNVDWNNYELMPSRLADVGVHKSFTWIRPEHMEPKDDSDLIQIETKMMNQFSRCDSVLNLLKNGEGILCTTTMSVNGIGKMDVYQYVYFLVLHAKRHLTQLENNRSEFYETNNISK